MLTRAYTAGGGGGVNLAGDFKESVRATQDTQRNLNGFGNVDGVGLSDGTRVLLTGQTDGAENGIWEARAAGWTRPPDWQTGTVSAGAVIPVEPGGVDFGSTLWLLATADPIVVDTTALTILQITRKITKPSSFNLEAPSATEDGPTDFAQIDLVVEEIRAVLQGSSSPSVTWTIRYAADRNAAGTEIVTGGTVTTSITGQTVTVFNAPNIPAGSWIWLETTAQSGIVLSMTISVVFA